MFIWLIKIVTTGKCVRGGVFIWLPVIRTLKYPATVCQPSLFTWLLFLFFSEQEKSLWTALLQPHLFFTHLPSRRQTAQWCRNKFSALVALPRSANCGGDRRAGGGNNFKSLGCKIGVKYIFSCVLFYCTSSFSHWFIHQMPNPGLQYNLLRYYSNWSTCKTWCLRCRQAWWRWLYLYSACGYQTVWLSASCFRMGKVR